MRKSSNMGASKYEFCPEIFENDLVNNRERYSNKKESLYEKLNDILNDDPSRMKETFSMLIDVMIEIKRDYNL